MVVFNYHSIIALRYELVIPKCFHNSYIRPLNIPHIMSFCSVKSQKLSACLRSNIQIIDNQWFINIRSCRKASSFLAILVSEKQYFGCRFLKSFHQIHILAADRLLQN